MYGPTTSGLPLTKFKLIRGKFFENGSEAPRVTGSQSSNLGDKICKSILYLGNIFKLSKSYSFPWP